MKKLLTLALTTAVLSSTAIAQEKSTQTISLYQSVLLHASFDGSLNAEKAAGDHTLYTASTGDREQPVPGLPEGNLVVHAKREGKYGDALQFTQKMQPVVFFKGEKNLNFQEKGPWNGACSFWLRLDPNKDLEPGYCDPLQFVAQDWYQGNMFVEFSKDNPRHFRYAIQAVRDLWNPEHKGWEDIPAAERPMVQVVNPPFSREQWTHIVFNFENLNTGDKNGVGQLYVNGELKGEFKDRQQTFNWEIPKSALAIGLSYVGYFDDVAVFNRPLSADEVKLIYGLENGIATLKKPLTAN